MATTGHGSPCRCPLECLKGVAPNRDGANRVFVLVGPPAEERRVPNDTLPIPSHMARRQTLLLRVALYGQRLTIETAIRSYRAPDLRNCRRFLCLSGATFDSPKPQHHWLRHSVRSVAFADKGGSGIRSTFAGGGPQSSKRDE
jgi:hypothetical protein